MSKYNIVKYSKDNINIHPILNIIDEIDPGHFTLPYTDKDNNILFYKKFKKKIKYKSINTFDMSINSKNFLDIIFNIKNIDSLILWLKDKKLVDIDIINNVINIYWKNNYKKFSNMFDKIIELNDIIINIKFKIKLDNSKLLDITHSVINYKYNNKTNYIDILKKYIP